MKHATRTRLVVLALLASAVPCASAQACTKTWAGGSGDWTAATAWSPAGAPTATDDVCLPADSTYTVTVPAFGSDGTLVRSIAIGGDGPGRPTLEILGASLTATAGGTIAANGVLVIDDGSLEIDRGATLVNMGAVQTKGSGAVHVLGASWTQAGGTVTGAPVVLRDSLLDYESGSGSFRFLPAADGGTSRLAGTIPTGSSVTLAGATVELQGPQVTNDGELQLLPGPAYGDATLTGAPLLNDGLLNATTSPTGRAAPSFLRVDVTSIGDIALTRNALLVQDAGTVVENRNALVLSTGSRYTLSSNVPGRSSRLVSNARAGEIALALGRRPTAVIDVRHGGRFAAPHALDTILDPSFDPFPGRVDPVIENSGGTIVGRPAAFAAPGKLRIAADGSVSFRLGLFASGLRATRLGFTLDLSCPTSYPCYAIAIATANVPGGSRTPVVVGVATTSAPEGVSPLSVRLNARGRDLLAHRHALVVTVLVRADGHALLHAVIPIRG